MEGEAVTLGTPGKLMYRTVIQAERPRRAKLRWEQQSDEVFWGYGGELIIGMVLKPHAGPYVGKWKWSIYGVARSAFGSQGARKDSVAARRAADQAWAKWVEAAGLEMKP